MHGFRPVVNGMVANVPPDILRECSAFFKSYIRSCQDYKFLTDPGAIQSLVGRIKQITGRSFFEFAMVNYENGHGKRARIFRHIAEYQRGEISGRALKSYFDVEQDICVAMQVNDTPYAGAEFGGMRNEDTRYVIDAINEKTLYSILACIGPSNMCRFMLTFTGEYFDGQY